MKLQALSGKKFTALTDTYLIKNPGFSLFPYLILKIHFNNFELKLISKSKIVIE
jgi:hypothetical protein